MSANTKSHLAIARDEWFESEQGKICCDGTAKGQYLRNRLETAFLAGAKHGSDHISFRANCAIKICNTISKQVKMGRHLLVGESILQNHAERWRSINGGDG